MHDRCISCTVCNIDWYSRKRPRVPSNPHQLVGALAVHGVGVRRCGRRCGVAGEGAGDGAGGEVAAPSRWTMVPGVLALVAGMVAELACPVMLPAVVALLAVLAVFALWALVALVAVSAVAALTTGVLPPSPAVRARKEAIWPRVTKASGL